MPSFSSKPSDNPGLFPRARGSDPAQFLVAHTDGGARGNPGPAGYGVVIEDEAGKEVAKLSQYLGHQTNNVAEYQALIAALEYAVQNGSRAMRVISDSELMVKQIKGLYKVKNSTLQDLYHRAKELIAQLDWFRIEHVLRGHNAEADRLANEAMDKQFGARSTPAQARISQPQEFEGVVRGGVVELSGGPLPEGTRVQLRIKK